jgi:hypothetical protein
MLIEGAGPVAHAKSSKKNANNTAEELVIPQERLGIEDLVVSMMASPL